MWKVRLSMISKAAPYHQDKSHKVSDKRVDLDTGKRPDPKDESAISKIRVEPERSVLF